MRRVTAIYFALFLLVAGCIKNDIPYPYIELRILSMQVEGQSSVRINNDARTVTFAMEETADLRDILVTGLSVTEGGVASIEVGDRLDLTEPYTVVISQYQDFEWSIIATQSIERYFTVEDQVGSAIISERAHRAIALVPEGSDLSNINVTALKLGPTGSEITPSFEELHDFSDPQNPVLVTLTYLDYEEVWELFVMETDILVETSAVYPWVKIAWLTGYCRDGYRGGFEYCRNDGTDIWYAIDSTQITQEGNTFTAKLTGLRENTSYKCRAVVDTIYGSEVEFTTGVAVELPNGSFDSWWKDGKVWNPWIEGEENFWDTGNRGATSLGESNSVPSDDERWDSKENGNGAKLCSKFVGLGSVGKFAAGNIFVGDFKEIDGTNGILDFGKPFTSFPTRLIGHYRYTTAIIDNYTEETAYMVGAPDTLAIYMALGDWDSPVEIRTRPSRRKLLEKDDPNIIAYAEMYSPESTNGYIDFSLEFEYRDITRTPKYLIIVLSASKYGDYFTGGNGATLWVDELELEYD